MKREDRKELLKLWEQYSLLVGSDQTQETIQKENELIGVIESKMPFKNEQQHQKWLDTLFSYRFWEDIEELTMSIINEKGKELNMRFNYKKRTFELMELKEIGTNATYDIVTIFEIIKKDGYESLNYVNFFYGVSENKEELKAIAKPYIDGYFKQCKLNDLILNLRAAYDNFEKDESTIEYLDDAQYDLLDFINENIVL